MSSDTHRVLLLIDQLTIGGQEESFMLLAEQLADSPYEPVLGYVKDGPYRERAESAGIELIQYHDRYLLSPKNVLSAAWSLYRLVRREDLDLIHSSSVQSYIWGFLATRLARVPHVVTHGNLFREHEPTFARLMDWTPFSERLAHAYICGVETQMTELRELGIGENRLFFIRPGVDLERFQLANDGTAVRDEFGIPEGVPVVGMLQRAQQGLGWEMLVEAVEPVLDCHPETHFLLVGDGPLLADIREKIDRKELAEHVTLPGYRTDSPEIIAALDIASNTPDNAPGGQFIREAMASGTPVITSDDENQRTFITDRENGLLVEPGDSAGLAKAINWLLDNPEQIRKIGTKGRAYAEEYFDSEQVATAYRAVYEELLTR